MCEPQHWVTPKRWGSYRHPNLRHFLDINQEREFGYEGYQGMLELVRQLALTIESPVWQAVRTPAPWKASKAA